MCLRGPQSTKLSLYATTIGLIRLIRRRRTRRGGSTFLLVCSSILMFNAFASWHLNLTKRTVEAHIVINHPTARPERGFSFLVSKVGPRCHTFPLETERGLYLCILLRAYRPLACLAISPLWPSSSCAPE